MQEIHEQQNEDMSNTNFEPEPQPQSGLDPRHIVDVIINSANAVMRVLGTGFLESVYERSLVEELALRGIKSERQKRFQLTYRGADVGVYIADLIVADSIIVEVKAVSTIEDAHWKQCLNYLAAAGLMHGLVLNFGPNGVRYRKVGNDRAKPRA